MISFASISDSDCREFNEESSFYFYYLMAFICSRCLMPQAQQDYISYEIPVDFIIINQPAYLCPQQSILKIRQSNVIPSIIFPIELNSMPQKLSPTFKALNQTGVYEPEPIPNRYPVGQAANKTSNSQNFPLHSHSVFSNSHQSFSSSLRILNCSLSHGQARILDSLDKDNLAHHQKKFGFGSTSIRQVKIFQKPQFIEHTQQVPDISHSLTSHSFFHCKSLLQQTQQTSHLASNFVQKSTTRQKHSKVGFGVGISLNRAQIQLDQLFRLGPGSYQISKSFQKSKDKKLQTTFRKLKSETRNKQNIIKNIRKSEQPSNQIDLLSLSHKKNVCKEKQKWKQILMEKKQKMRNLLSKMKENSPNLQQRIIPMKLQRDLPFKLAQKQQLSKSLKNWQRSHKKSKKLLRVQLKQKTNAFLPPVDEVKFDENLRQEYKGPLYKLMFSNSFVQKNDHTFEAHLYKPKQKESQYVFFKGKSEPKPQQNQSCFFKSKLSRKIC